MIWIYTVLFNIVLICINKLIGVDLQLPHKTTVDLIEDANYPVETHDVITEDGYILTLHRIPYNKKETNNNNISSKGPVLLMHGLFCSSADWLVFEKKSLGFLLADAGYDVWMGNNRGNTYSKKNINLDPYLNWLPFWNFSYHEMGVYDLPTTIDYILNITEKKKIPYVGIAQGVNIFGVLMSEKPEYNKKIQVANFWAPTINLQGAISKFINILADFPVIEIILDNLKFYQILSYDTFGNILRLICINADWFCSIVLNLNGASWERMPDQALKLKVMQNYPAGISLKQMYHYVQSFQSGIFRPFDYGEIDNIKEYGKNYPDPYNLSNIDVPVFIYYGKSDIYCNSETLLSKVVPQIKNVTVKNIPLDNFNHIDFVYSTDTDWLTGETINNINQAKYDL